MQTLKAIDTYIHTRKHLAELSQQSIDINAINIHTLAHKYLYICRHIYLYLCLKSSEKNQTKMQTSNKQQQFGERRTFVCFNATIFALIFKYIHIHMYTCIQP